MAKVIPGTKKLAQVNKALHPAAAKKIRCSACKIGMALEVETEQGKKFKCDRCGREFGFTAF